MKKYINGKYVEMTDEEIKNLQSSEPSQVIALTAEERLEAVESAVQDLIFSALGGTA
ncbi:MAG: hypothetical protein J1E56_07630 [Ruminococcus sp.]|nr:hypothetical protein [Ruminococcus sp.]